MKPTYGQADHLYIAHGNLKPGTPEYEDYNFLLLLDKSNSNEIEIILSNKAAMHWHNINKPLEKPINSELDPRFDLATDFYSLYVIQHWEHFTQAYLNRHVVIYDRTTGAYRCAPDPWEPCTYPPDVNPN